MEVYNSVNQVFYQATGVSDPLSCRLRGLKREFGDTVYFEIFRTSVLSVNGNKSGHKGFP